MTSKIRWHLDELQDDPKLLPKHLTKEQFGRRLFQLMDEKGWSQSELARRAGMLRDSVSTYINGKSLPTPKNLNKLAKALGVSPGDLLPNSIEGAIDEDTSSMEMKVSSARPGRAWLRVNRMVSIELAAKIIQMLAAADHEAADAGRGGQDPAPVGERGEEDAVEG